MGPKNNKKKTKFVVSGEDVQMISQKSMNTSELNDSTAGQQKNTDSFIFTGKMSEIQKTEGDDANLSRISGQNSGRNQYEEEKEGFFSSRSDNSEKNQMILTQLQIEDASRIDELA